VSLYAATNGYVDATPVTEVRRFEGELLEWFRSRHRDILDGIRADGDIPDVEAFEVAIKGFAEQFSWEQAADDAARTEVADADAPADPSTDSQE
jgi:F0F1-type ATP synthase alpha subunit